MTEIQKRRLKDRNATVAAHRAHQARWRENELAGWPPVQLVQLVQRVGEVAGVQLRYRVDAVIAVATTTAIDTTGYVRAGSRFGTADTL